eukprot:294900-Rhodomonas_salina.2
MAQNSTSKAPGSLSHHSHSPVPQDVLIKLQHSMCATHTDSMSKMSILTSTPATTTFEQTPNNLAHHTSNEASTETNWGRHQRIQFKESQERGAHHSTKRRRT